MDSFRIVSRHTRWREGEVTAPWLVQFKGEDHYAKSVLFKLTTARTMIRPGELEYDLAGHTIPGAYLIGEATTLTIDDEGVATLE